MQALTYSQNSFTGSVRSEAETFATVSEQIFFKVPLIDLFQQCKSLRSYGLTQFTVFQKLLHERQGTSEKRNI